MTAKTRPKMTFKLPDEPQAAPVPVVQATHQAEQPTKGPGRPKLERGELVNVGMRINGPLWRQFKSLAAAEGKTTQEIATMLFKKWCDEEED
jgi:hypothetical protein